MNSTPGELPIRRNLTQQIGSIQFRFLHPHACAAAVLANEFDSGGFKRKLHGLNSSRRHDSLFSLGSDHG